MAAALRNPFDRQAAWPHSQVSTHAALLWVEYCEWAAIACSLVNHNYKEIPFQFSV